MTPSEAFSLGFYGSLGYVLSGIIIMVGFVVLIISIVFCKALYEAFCRWRKDQS